MPTTRESSWPRYWIHGFYISCVGRQVLYHWATWEASSTSSHFLIKANKVLHHLPIVLRIKANSPNIIFKNEIPVFVSSFISDLSFYLLPHHSYNLPTVILKVISSLQYIPCFSLPGILPVLFFSAWNISSALQSPPAFISQTSFLFLHLVNFSLVLGLRLAINPWVKTDLYNLQLMTIISSIYPLPRTTFLTFNCWCKLLDRKYFEVRNLLNSLFQDPSLVI